jgi:GTP-binding protein Era
LGIQNREEAQFIFIDTPGFQTRLINTLNKALNRTVTTALQDVNVACFVVEAGYFGEDDKKVLKLLPDDLPVVLVLNKLDLFNSRFQTPSERDQALLNFIKEMACPWCELGGHEDQKSEFAEIVPMSAKSPGDIERLLVYDGDTITDRSERFLAAEILREKVFRFTGEELPYTSTVVIDQFKMDGKMRRIAATILVDRDSHKAMIIGAKGERLKKISTDARIDMEKLFDGKVFLETWVKVKRGWADDRAELRAQGLE